MRQPKPVAAGRRHARRRARRWRIAIGVGAAIAALAAGRPTSGSAQTGVSGACTVSDASPDGPAVWSSASQSLWGCEGWVYAFAVRNQRVTYGRWSGARAISVSMNGVALTADEGAQPLQWKLDMVDYLQTLVEDGQQDVDGFWRGLVAAEPGPVKQFARPSPPVYTSPRRVASLADSTPTPCGVIAADNAHYCSGDSTVYLGRAFFLGELSLGGNFLPILILSHEWGHHIQNILDLNPLGIPRSLNSTNIELQADCFA